jgi:hypothetical protein
VAAAAAIMVDGSALSIMHGRQRAHSIALQVVAKLVTHKPDPSTDKHEEYVAQPSHSELAPQLSAQPEVEGKSVQVWHLAQPLRSNACTIGPEQSTVRQSRKMPHSAHIVHSASQLSGSPRQSRQFAQFIALQVATCGSAQSSSWTQLP